MAELIRQICFTLKQISAEQAEARIWAAAILAGEEDTYDPKRAEQAIREWRDYRRKEKS